MSRKYLQILSAAILLTMLSAFTYERRPSSAMKHPTTTELSRLGKQMAATVIRGVAWPTKNTIKGCWREDELPNIDIDAEIDVNPDYDAIEPTYRKLRRIKIHPSPAAKRRNFDYDRKDRRFAYKFYLRIPMPKKSINNKTIESWVSCKPKPGAKKMCRLVRKRDRELFQIIGGIRTPNPEKAAELKALEKEGNRSVVPGFEVYFGDIWATRFLRVIRKKCAVERAI